MLDSFFLTSVSIGTFIVFIFEIIMGVLLLSIKNRSKATFHLGIGLILISFHALGLCIGPSIYHQIGVIHRYIIVFFLLLGLIHFGQFFFYFPNPKFSRFAKIMLIFQYAVSIIFSAFYVKLTLHAEKVFNFAGHYWAFDVPALNKTFAVIIIIYIFINFLVFSIWRAIITPGKDRFVIIAIALSLLIAAIPGSLANSMSRSGAMDRGTFAHIFTLSVIVGFFILIIIYFNNTRDKTTLLSKIIGINLAIFSIIFQFISYYYLNDYERLFNEIYHKNSIIALNKKTTSSDISYIIYNEKGNNIIKEKYLKNGVSIFFSNVEKKIENRHYRIDKNNLQHYIGLSYKDKNSKRIYEVGFSYENYRKYIHAATSRLIIIFLIILPVILIGFRLFFLGVFIHPLYNLLYGLNEISQGNLDIQIPLKVKDEIGQVSKIFNRMATVINNAKKELDINAEELENKVVERTSELNYALEELHLTYKSLKKKDEIMEKDLFLAKGIQKKIMPKTKQIKNFKFLIKYLPMAEIGGDIYDITELKNGNIRIFLADAIGHGVGAALITMLIKSEYELLKKIIDNPAKLLEDLNEGFINNYALLNMYFTCIVIDFNIAKKQIQYSSAGHPTQYLISEDVVTALKKTGKLIGVQENTKYKLNKFNYQKNGKLLLFTDGLFEEFNDIMDEFGEKSITNIIDKCKDCQIETIINNILEELQKFVGEKKQINDNDDITIIGVDII